MIELCNKNEVDTLYELLPFGSFALGTNDRSSDLDLVLCTYGATGEKDHLDCDNFEQDFGTSGEKK